MKKHSIEAQRLLDELDAELAANGAAAVARWAGVHPSARS
jgi:hypothetical protein